MSCENDCKNCPYGNCGQNKTEEKEEKEECED